MFFDQLIYNSVWDLLVVFKDDTVAMSNDVCSSIVQLFLVVVHQLSVKLHFLLNPIHLNTVLVDRFSDLTLVFLQCLLNLLDHTKMSISIVISKVIVCVKSKQEAIERPDLRFSECLPEPSSEQIVLFIKNASLAVNVWDSFFENIFV